MGRQVDAVAGGRPERDHPQLLRTHRADRDLHRLPGSRGSSGVAGPAKVVITLGSTSNLVANGHRVRLDISSSSFPRFEPNPNQSINELYHDLKPPSYLELPVMVAPER